jgi:hypothetical protein
LTGDVFVTQLPSNAGNISWTNCVGQDKLLFHERFVSIRIGPATSSRLSVREFLQISVLTPLLSFLKEHHKDYKAAGNFFALSRRF